MKPPVTHVRRTDDGGWAFFPDEPSLCWDVKVGWVPVRAIDPATGRCYVQGPAPTYEAP